MVQSLGGWPSRPSPATLTVEVCTSRRPVFRQRAIRFFTPVTLTRSRLSSLTKCFTRAAQLMQVSKGICSAAAREAASVTSALTICTRPSARYRSRASSK